MTKAPSTVVGISIGVWIEARNFGSVAASLMGDEHFLKIDVAFSVLMHIDVNDEVERLEARNERSDVRMHYVVVSGHRLIRMDVSVGVVAISIWTAERINEDNQFDDDWLITVSTRGKILHKSSLGLDGLLSSLICAIAIVSNIDDGPGRPGVLRKRGWRM